MKEEGIMTKAESLFDFVTLTLDDIVVDPSKNIRAIKKASEPRMAQFIAAMGSNGIPAVKVTEKGAKGYPLFYGYQRVGAATYIRDFLVLVKEMIPIRDEEEKESAKAGTEVVNNEAREALEKKHGDLCEEFVKWKETEATKEKLAELRGSPEEDPKTKKVVEFTLKEIEELLTKWEAKTHHIPAQVTDEKDPFERKLQQIAENIDRLELTANEEAQAVSDLVEHLVDKKKMEKIPAMTLVGQKLGGRSLSWVQQSLSILKAAAPVQEALQSGEVSRSQALAIVREKSVGGQKELLEKAKKGATVRALSRSRKPTETKKNAKKKKGQQQSLLPTQKLKTKIGKNEVEIVEGDGGEFTVNVSGENLLAFTVTKKGAVKVSGTASAILNVKTDLGHVVVQHDTSTEGRFSIDVDGSEVAEFILDGKGDADLKSIPKGEREKGSPAKGKKQAARRKAKAKAAASAG